MVRSIKSNIIKKGLPLIEKDDDNYIITFIYLNSSSKNISVIGSFPGFSIENQRLKRISNTDIWYKSYKINKPINFTYGFVKNSNQESFNINNIFKDLYNKDSMEVYQSKDTILNLSTVEMIKNKE